ncbi:MAG TPA: RIP metalloprotease RseP [Rhodocyclaceae bacterium]|nr:RIP metalloprotease RseP [Rhodocyclaceae bacterium]HNH34402.1 RIP metalloprotease RseP [Rhodocyclaceae bacterium]
MGTIHPAVYLASFAFGLGILIFFHEFGHFVAARACGVKVLKFSVGFGRAILSRRLGRDGTEWALGVFPLGGYVRMLDEREGPVPDTDLGRAFNRQSVARRMAIVAAGPLANFVLAIILYWLVFMGGVDELRPVLAKPPEGSPAAIAGVADGELIRAVDKRPVETWSEVRWAILKAGVDRKAVELEVMNPKGEIAFHRLETAVVSFADGEAKDPLKDLGLRLFRPRIPPLIGQVVDGSVAEQAGLRAGDRFLEVDGKPVADWSDVAGGIRAAPGREIVLVVERNGHELSLRVTPSAHAEGKATVGRIGIAVRESDYPREALFARIRYGPLEAAERAVGQTWETTTFSFAMIGRMLTGDVSWRNLSGPVTIADYAGQSASLGASQYLRFLALISISLGVLNLLPIPILDGGHLMYYSAEILKGGPLSERAMEIGQQIGLVLLGLLMAFAFYNDIYRLVSG